MLTAVACSAPMNHARSIVMLTSRPAAGAAASGLEIPSGGDLRALRPVAEQLRSIAP